MISLYVFSLLVMSPPAEPEQILSRQLLPFTHSYNHARYPVRRHVIFPGLVFSGPDDAAIYRLKPVYKGASS